MTYFRWVVGVGFLIAIHMCENARVWSQGPIAPISNSIGMSLVKIPKGTFEMGAKEGGFFEKEIKNDFYIGMFEVTQSQYQTVMGENPSYFQGKRAMPWSGELPVENVTWNEAMEFCVQLSSREAEKSAGRHYRLPTETEWEYACRAGSTTLFSFGDDVGLLGDYAWYGANSSNQTHEVGRKKPNAWGVCDMHGNVSEFCSDWYRVGSKPGDGVERANGWFPLRRGGDYHHSQNDCRSGCRIQGIAAEGTGATDQSMVRRENCGFRVVMTMSGGDNARAQVARQPEVPQKQPVPNKQPAPKKQGEPGQQPLSGKESASNPRKPDGRIDANVTLTDPFVLPRKIASIGFRKEAINALESLRQLSNLKEDPSKRMQIESSPTLELLHKDFSLTIIPRTVIYLEGNRIEFSERATLSGHQGLGSDYVVFLTNEATIPVRIAKAAAPRVALSALKETLELRKQGVQVYTIRGKGLQFLSVRPVDVSFSEYDLATKDWKGEILVELVNNSEVQRITLKYNQRRDVTLGGERVSLECKAYDSQRGTFQLEVETEPQQAEITATFGEYAAK